MNENPQEKISEKTATQEQIKDKPLSNNKSSRSKITEHQKIMHFQMFSCLKRYFNYFI